MSNWDFRNVFAPAISYAESQLGEGGVNAANNCVSASFIAALLAYGYPDMHAPEDWTAAEYGPSYHGYTDFGHAIDYMQRNYGNAPSVAVSNPNDTIGWIDAAAAQRFPTVCTFWCDGNANIGAGGTSIHASPVLAHIDGVFSVLNVWRGQIVQINDADFRAATRGWQVGVLGIFQRSLPGEPMAHMIQKAVALAVTASGNGYWILGDDGAIFTFGDARYFGGGNNLPGAGGPDAAAGGPDVPDAQPVVDPVADAPTDTANPVQSAEQGTEPAPATAEDAPFEFHTPTVTLV